MYSFNEASVCSSYELRTTSVVHRAPDAVREGVKGTDASYTIRV